MAETVMQMRGDDLVSQLAPEGAIARLEALIESARKVYASGFELGGELIYPAWTFDAAHVCRLAKVASRAQAIADEAARSDIECHCRWTSEDPALRWFDTSTIEDEAREPALRELVDRSIAYLALRGALVRNAENSALVRIALR